jgi:hypothetical protein
MRDLRERLDRELERIVPGPGARAEIERRALRRRRRSRAFLAPTTLLLAVGLVAGLTYAFRSAPNRGGQHTENSRSERARLMAVHIELEGLLGHIWAVESDLSQVRGQIDDARRQIRKLFDRMGSNPTDDQLGQLESLRVRIGAWKRTIELSLAQISLIEAQVAKAEARRDELIPPSDASAYPDVAVVICDGGAGPERTRLSTPVVGMQAEGVHLRVTNLIATHEIYLIVQPDGVWTIPGGETRNIVMPPHRAHDAEIACAYGLPTEGWQGPTHPLWIAGPDACPVAPFTVSRLPWLQEGSEVPAPESIEEGVDTILVWFDDPIERWSGRYVALKRSTTPPVGEGLGEFPAVPVRGVTARLVWIGDPGVGELALTWREGDQACRWYSLTISSVGLTQREAEVAIHEVAASIS